MVDFVWEDNIEELTSYANSGMSASEIGKIYGVSAQRIYQVLTKFGISTPFKKKKNFLRDKGPKYYWLNKMLCTKKIPKLDRIELLESLVLPDVCPVFGVDLNYCGGTGGVGFTRTENSPSLDRIDSSVGYIKGNIQIICWRANRIKNDSTPEELKTLAKYMEKFT